MDIFKLCMDTKTTLEQLKQYNNNFDGDFNLCNEYGDSPLRYLCMCHKSNIAMIKYAISRGADLNHKGSYNTTPFHTLCHFINNLEFLKYCVDAGADLNSNNDNYCTPFHNLCGSDRIYNSKEHVKMLKYAIHEKQCDLLYSVNGTNTPLFTLLNNRYLMHSTKILKHIIKHHEKLNIPHKTINDYLRERKYKDVKLIPYVVVDDINMVY